MLLPFSPQGQSLWRKSWRGWGQVNYPATKDGAFIIRGKIVRSHPEITQVVTSEKVKVPQYSNSNWAEARIEGGCIWGKGLICSLSCVEAEATSSPDHIILSQAKTLEWPFLALQIRGLDDKGFSCDSLALFLLRGGCAQLAWASSTGRMGAFGGLLAGKGLWRRKNTVLSTLLHSWLTPPSNEKTG